MQLQCNCTRKTGEPVWAGCRRQSEAVGFGFFPPVLHPSCPASRHSCISPVLHPTCPASHAPVLYPSCLASFLFHIPPVLNPPFLYPRFPVSVQSCITIPASQGLRCTTYPKFMQIFKQIKKFTTRRKERLSRRFWSFFSSLMNLRSLHSNYWTFSRFEVWSK